MLGQYIIDDFPVGIGGGFGFGFHAVPGVRLGVAAWIALSVVVWAGCCRYEAEDNGEDSM